MKVIDEAPMFLISCAKVRICEVIVDVNTGDPTAKGNNVKNAEFAASTTTPTDTDARLPDFT